MEILEKFGAALAAEWQKLPGFAKVVTLVIAILESLVLFVLKDEILNVLNRWFLGHEQELLLLLVFAIIPLVSLITVFLFTKLFTAMQFPRDRRSGMKPTHALSDEDIEIPEKYEPLKQLSQSIFSTVFLVRDKQTDKKYLLKQLTNTTNLEKTRLPRIKNLATPIASFEQNGKSYELLKYYEGWTLAELMELNRSNIGVCGALLGVWTDQILEILIPLHLNNPPIVHRDISPTNILVRSDTLDVVLLDASCAVTSSSWAIQQPLGTATYSAPEQLNGQAVPASDIYSLGMTIYAINHCVEPPLTSSRMHASKEPLELINNRGWNRLNTLFRLSTQLDPSKRPLNADEAKRFLRDLATKPEIFLGMLKLPSGDEIEMNILS